MSWVEWAARECDAIRAARLWRRVCDFDARGPAGRMSPSGQQAVSFASNDYLGLSAHPAVTAAARAALGRWGAGAGSARLIVGSRPVHSRLERDIAAWKGTERAVLFPTGFHANLGVLATFGERGAVIFSDELNHASIVDGCRLARADVRVYPHRDVAWLRTLLAGAERALVVTDTVFSMDGHLAPVDELVRLCARHEALLVLDEAHAVLGPEPRLEGVEALRVGTLSKFLGTHGGYVAGPAPLIDLIINRARAYIFTTAPPPPVAAAARAALRVLQSEEGDRLKRRLRTLVERLAPGHPSPIIPFLLGGEKEALGAAEELRKRGLLVPAIRPPSVPPGGARLRVTLSAAHTDAQVAMLSEALAHIARVGTRA